MRQTIKKASHFKNITIKRNSLRIISFRRVFAACSHYFQMQDFCDYIFKKNIFYWIEYLSLLNKKKLLNKRNTSIFANVGVFFYCLSYSRNGILLPKLFWPTVRKICSSDREKLWNSRLKAENLQHFWDHWNNLLKQW